MRLKLSDKRVFYARMCLRLCVWIYAAFPNRFTTRNNIRSGDEASIDNNWLPACAPLCSLSLSFSVYVYVWWWCDTARQHHLYWSNKRDTNAAHRSRPQNTQHKLTCSQHTPLTHSKQALMRYTEAPMDRPMVLCLKCFPNDVTRAYNSESLREQRWLSVDCFWKAGK